MQLGDTFLFNVNKSHLWIVASDPSRYGGCFVFVNLTSDSFRAGTECSLIPGDHPWIAKQTWVNFGDAREVTPKEEATMQTLIASNFMISHAPMGATQLEKIRVAALVSRAIPKKLKKYFE